MPAAASPQNYTDQYAKDRAEIEDLMARYLFAMDYNDMDSYAATFTEDGELEFASGTAVGRDNIKATAKAFKDRIATVYKDVDGNPAVLRHVLAQTVIRVEGDRAWARAFWYEMANDGPKNEAGRKTPQMGTFGIYEDELRKVDGQWLFSKRRILNEFLDGRHSGSENPVAEMDRLAE
ncbi:hypothetical protein FHS61_002769 [Altererythrobacter atlanticus]|uniref:Uncharacterized protein n=1 Tax=Croceibacterium atlanticum TaxID=1267766 RepID=A0A0F7KVS9_9SPHN|nr:nuclear transport factor 2 family protein [Croceibacterium atlanticum]AKH43824.1 hypothetical protein WYH_02795 [Croceibacterium atlanticum]MBB5733726.1 hypothetical protein [Croceibacterium atlanticum]